MTGAYQTLSPRLVLRVGPLGVWVGPLGPRMTCRMDLGRRRPGDDHHDMEARHIAPAERVLLAVDLTTSSLGAVEEAIKLAATDGADLIVLSVVEPANLSLPGGLTRRVDQERDRLVSGVREIVRRAQDVGVSSTYLIWEGDPAESIVEASIAERVDVIVLGCRPRSIRRLLQGSVSAQVTRTAACQVRVVPA